MLVVDPRVKNAELLSDSVDHSVFFFSRRMMTKFF